MKNNAILIPRLSNLTHFTTSFFLCFQKFITKFSFQHENCQTNLAGPSKSPFENAQKCDLENKVCHSNFDLTLNSSTDENLEKENRIEDDSCSQKELPKTRRASVFKRVTSMENLKSHRERQRQFIKKSSKLDDSKRKKTMKPDDECLTSDESEFNCSHCDKKFTKQDQLSNHEKLHESKVKCDPVVCQICEKSFRKTDTMVRHLNLHKKANPKEVFSILKEMRDRRRMENNCLHENKEELNVDFDGNPDDNEALGDSNTSYGCDYQPSSDDLKETTFSCTVCNMKFNR